MKNIRFSKISSILFLVLIFLLFLKIDFRFEEGIFCCGDDHDYYAHAETIVVDFDFDYSNQFFGNENRRFNLNGKIAPKGFFGSGLLAAPFLFLGVIFENISNSLFSNPFNSFMNYKLFFYSMSAPSYFFITTYLLFSIFKLNKINVSPFNILLLLSSSGVAYFAFERFSMTHVYEVFTVTLIFYNSFNFYISENKNKYGLFTAFAILLAFLVRMVNYYIIFIPLIVKFLLNKKTKINIYSNSFFLFGSLISIFIFIFLSLNIYGIISINPETLYGQKGLLNNFISSENLFDFILLNLKNTFIVIFGKEFGLLWFSPILIYGPLMLLFKYKKYNKMQLLILFIPFVQSMGAVLLWQSTASSYGFRYLYSLAPVAIIYYYFNIDNLRYLWFDNALKIFCIFSLVSILFFETTELTQLSLTPEINSFGRNLRYVEPNYLIGYINSFLVLDSYLKIFTTSFLGIITFKLLFLIFGTSSMINIFENLGLPTNNSDFINLTSEIELVSFTKLLLVIIYFIVISKFFLDKQKAF
jgi:hypothetical protein